MNNCPVCQSPLRLDETCPVCLLKLALNYKKAHLPEETLEELRDLNALFPQLEIQRLVGRGGMGAIYQARQTSLDRNIALKVIDRSISNDTNFLNRFEREAKALAKLAHPNIVSIYDFGHTSDGTAYFMMEYIHGLNLREAIQSMPIDVPYALEIVRATAEALQYAHSKGIIHRDIKPENILLSDDGRIKLADFGIAKINNTRNDRKITATRQVLGTVHYLAPEQLESPHEVDHRIDIYALGVILYELLTLQVPVGNFEPASQLNPNVPLELDQVILRSLHRKPATRFQSAEEFARAIEKCANLLPEYLQPLEPTLPTHQKVIGVPFEAQAVYGFAEVQGTMQVTHLGLKLEFRTQDAFFGGLKSNTETIEVPWNRLLRIAYRPGILNGTFHISGDTFSVFEKFPNNHLGTISLKVKRKNTDLVQSALDSIRQYQPNLLPVASRKKHESPEINIGVAFGIIALGIFNFAILMILLVTISTQSLTYYLPKDTHDILAVVIFSILAPHFTAQLGLGIAYVIAPYRKLAQLGAFTCMIPTTPLFPISFIFGWWALKQFNPKPSAATPTPKPQTPRWGLTTTIFEIESKYATLISILESALGVALAAILLAWTIGFYPYELRLRCIGPVDEEAISSFAKNRLYGFQDVLSYAEADRLTVRCLQFQRKGIIDALRIAEAPSLVVCTKNLADMSPDSATFIPSLTGPEIKYTVSRQVAATREILISREIPIPPQWLAKIETQDQESIAVTWSREGLLKLQQLIDLGDKELVLGLKINGWIEAFSLDSPLRDKTTHFKWIQPTETNSDSVKAALRGPNLPVEFEMLN